MSDLVGRLSVLQVLLAERHPDHHATVCEAIAELKRLRADAEILNFLAERQWHMPDFSDDARCYRVTVWADGYWLTSEKATFRDAVNDLMRKVREG